MVRSAAIFLIVGMLAACASVTTPTERRVYADRLALSHRWQPEVIPAGRFELVAYRPQVIQPDDILTVYIEGDGYSWIDRYTPSINPTPRDPVGLRLALAQPAGNVAYLARPCQYLQINQANCPPRLWTDARFSPEVVEATDRAIHFLKKLFGATKLTLVGYSGGGTVAALVAARRNDVTQIVTVAGNMDHVAWTNHHNIRPLIDSLNPADEVDRLLHIRQWHWVGSDDRIVPPLLLQSFAEHFPAGKQPMVEVIPGFDHQCYWVEVWPSLWSKMMP